MATKVSAQDGKGDLARLLSTEQRLEQLVVQARAEAARILADAQARAEARDTATRAELDRAVRDLTEGIATERAQRKSALEAALAGEAARFDAVTNERIAELARYVVRRVIGEGSALPG